MVTTTAMVRVRARARVSVRVRVRLGFGLGLGLITRTLTRTLTPNQVAGTIGTALAVSSLGVVITLLGAVCSTSVQFILPGAAYFVLFRDPGGCKRWLALAQLLLGLILMPLCLTLAFL